MAPMALFQRLWVGYSGTLKSITSGLARVHGLVGAAVAKNPKKAILLTCIVVAVCSAGFVRIRTESNGDKLWIPQESQAMHDRRYVESLYGVTTRGANVLASAPHSGDKLILGTNVLSVQTTWDLFQLHEKVLALSVAYEGKSYNYSSICYRNVYGACSQDGYLAYWNQSFDQFLATVGGSRSDRNAGNSDEFIRSVNARVFPDGQSVVPLLFLGGPQVNSSGAIVGAELVALKYNVGKSVSDGLSDTWFDAWLDLLKEQRRLSFQSVVLDYVADNSLDKEVSRSISTDTPKIAISVVMFIVISMFAMAKWDRVKTRVTLAVAGVLAIVLALAAAYGIASVCGLPFTTLQQVLPYVMLGVGVDVMFILVRGLDTLMEYNPSLDEAQRFYVLLETAGLSVLVSTATNLLSFGLGAITELPAIRWFCGYACLGVVANFIVQLTFFTACFVLTERRIAASRPDCCCCCGPVAAPADAPDVPAVKTSPRADGLPTAAPLPVADTTRDAGPAARLAWLPALRTRSSTAMKAFITSYYAPFLMRWPVKIAVILVFVAYFVASCIAFPNLTEGLPLQDIAPDDSYVKPYYDNYDLTFKRQLGINSRIYFRGFDQSDPVMQDKMFQALGAMAATRYINGTQTALEGQWLLELIETQRTNSSFQLTSSGCVNPWNASLKGCIPQASFYPALNAFLAQPEYRNYRNALLLDSQGRITDSYFTILHTAQGDDDKYTRAALGEVRHSERRINAELFAEANAAADGAHRPVVFVYQYPYIFWSGDASLRRAAVDYLIYAVVGVGVVLAVLLIQPVAVLLMMACVAFVVMFLYGEMWALDIKFNTVSVVNLIMATGLAVDYAIYFVVKFMATGGETRNQRVITSLEEYGEAILTGGLVSFIGVIPLAFSTSTILRTFFYLLFGTIIFSVLMGLMFLPVCFSLIGPPPNYLHSDAIMGINRGGLPQSPTSPKTQRDVEMARGLS